MILKIIFRTILLLILANCGYKIVDQNNIKNFKLIDVNITGDNRVAYLFKNKFRLNNSTSPKSVKLELNATKERNVKERNIQNEITKYEILVSARVNYFIIESNKSGEFLIQEKGGYTVRNKHSETLNNEKKLIKNMVNNISDQVFKDLAARIDEL